MAGQAVKAAVGSETSQRLWSSVRKAGKAAEPDKDA